MPYLPNNTSLQNRYTLVIDLDETLVHYDDQAETLNIRPHADTFLEALANHFELVVFSAGMQDYADWALDQIQDSRLYVTHRLYR